MRRPNNNNATAATKPRHATNTKRASKKMTTPLPHPQQQQQQQEQPLAAIVCSPMPARCFDETNLVSMTRFDRDDADREALFHTVLLRVISQFAKGNLSLEREGPQSWTIMSREARPLLLEFTLRHQRVHVLTHPTMTLATRTTYSIEMLLPGPTVMVSDLPLMARNNTARVLEALKAMAPTLFR
jgi:hypothetical protein